MDRLIYYWYRKVKLYAINRKGSLDARAFFGLLSIVERLFSARRDNFNQILQNSVWKQLYLIQYGKTPLYTVETQYPVAVASDDHKWPKGTLHDNSRNKRFNLRIYHYFKYKADLRVLDLGCSGGGVVRSFLEDGFEAVGLEGSDISKKLRSAEWDTCPLHLFTADIARPFTVRRADGAPYKAHCISAWEVLEHIPADGVVGLFTNVAAHLEKDGIFIASVASFPDENPLTGAVYHITLEPREWWLEKAARAGLVPVDGHPFKTEDYVRGRGVGLKDWTPADGDGFHLVLRKVQ